jgi:hypothetical protein
MTVAYVLAAIDALFGIAGFAAVVWGNRVTHLMWCIKPE